MSGDVITVRVPELPEHLTLSNLDRIPIWDQATNKTRQTSLQTLREFIETGDSGTIAPIQNGGTILYVVAVGETGDTISIPSIAGKSFKLLRDGYPLIPQSADPLNPNPDAEYEVLSAGGAKLLTTTKIDGQRYEFELYNFSTGVPAPTGDSGSGGFINGNVQVPTNLALSVNDLNKVIQLRGGVNAVTLTMPDVDLCPDNSFVVIECLITNSKQNKIATTDGQYIYIENESKLNLYISRGEYVWLYRGDDGWYAIASKGNFTNLAMPKAAYKVGLNQLLCNGSEVLRASYPRLWEYVQTLGSSLVSDTTWNTASAPVAGRTVSRPYRGCFSTGDGSTTFRLPDLMNSALRGIKSIGGSDSERLLNAAGGFQRHEFESHSHDTTFTELPNGASGNPGYDGGSNQYDTNKTKTTSSAGGTESRMDNVGVLWVIDY